MAGMDEADILRALADRLDATGFFNYREPIEEWIAGAEWDGGVHGMLGALRKTVWQDFGNVGETPQDWLDEHPKPQPDDFEEWSAYERAEKAWRDAASEAAKEPYHEAEAEILAAGKAIRALGGDGAEGVPAMSAPYDEDERDEPGASERGSASAEGGSMLRGALLAAGMRRLPPPTRDAYTLDGYVGEKRVDFGKKAARYEEKYAGAWRGYGPTVYYGWIRSIEDAAAWAFWFAGEITGERVAAPAPPPPSKADVRRAEKKRRHEIETSGPGLYVTNGSTSPYGLRVAELGPYQNMEDAEQAAWARYREFMGMRLDYLLPVQIVEVESRQAAAHFGTPGFSDVEGHVWWEDGKRRGPPVDPSQARLPGVAERRRRRAPAAVVDAVRDAAARWGGMRASGTDQRAMYRRDESDMRLVADMLASGDNERALEIAMTVDTDVREAIPRQAWIWLEHVFGDEYLAARPTPAEVERVVAG
jgi:hypothetical protein